MDLVEEVVSDTATVNFRFTFKQPSGRHVVTLKDVSKSYGDLTILKDTNAVIERGDKIALIGANGKGKSTLLRILSGTEPVEGERTIGYNVIQGFFAQHQLESLHVDNEILEELKQAGSGKLEQELRNVLGCFLFSDEDVFKKIKILSGGEKSRVALAKTLISEANFLLLDEPTNHLDFISENILIQALDQYLGTFVVVSHNRHFVSQVANKIWYIENQQIKEYPGTYDEYEYWRKQNAGNADAAPPAPKKESKPKQEVKSDETEKKIKSLQADVKRTEDLIAQLEKDKSAAEAELAKPDVYGNVDKLAKAQQQFEAIDKKLGEANEKWEVLVTQLDELA
jgi:ATP-binding cassette subfamily F protein 3